MITISEWYMALLWSKRWSNLLCCIFGSCTKMEPHQHFQICSQGLSHLVMENSYLMHFIDSHTSSPIPNHASEGLSSDSKRHKPRAQISRQTHQDNRSPRTWDTGQQCQTLTLMRCQLKEHFQQRNTFENLPCMLKQAFQINQSSGLL